MIPELRIKFLKYLEERNARTNREIIESLQDFIKENKIKASYIKESEAEDTGGQDEENNPYSGTPFLN